MNLLTRSQALTKGLSRYFTGKPCKNGHVAERKVANHTCVECAREVDRLRRENSKDWVAYIKQKSKAKARGIGWKFSFEQWLEFWEHKIAFKDGTQTGLVMCRYYDCGDYEPSNCYITTCEENFNEYLNGRYIYRPRNEHLI